MADVIVGLGNPGPRYRATRHNVGQWVVDRLARTLETTWRRKGDAMVASTRWREGPLILVKPRAFMNVCGPVVAASLRRSGATPGDLILVYDDIDLPLGTVRVRMRGSHGGHNGVRSVMETLGTSDIRRVKVGIGRPGHKDDVADYVLIPFAPSEIPAVESAVADAAERALELVRASSRRS